MLRHLLISSLIISLSWCAHSQDIHFSQFFNAPLQVNPAFTGLFSGDVRFGGNYRNQWQSVPVPYTTFSAYFDQKFYLPILNNSMLGGGLIFNYDRAGDANLSWTQLGINLSYIQQLADEHFLSGGFQLKGGQRALDPNLLNFGDQYNGDVFDPSQASQESLTKSSIAYFDLGAGAVWYFQDEDSRTHAQTGFSFMHVNQPNVSFFEEEKIHLNMLISLHQNAGVQLTDQFDLVSNILWQFQGAYMETVWVLSGKGYFDTGADTPLVLQAGVGYRLGDALFPYLGVQYLNWKAGFSYDINNSPFNVATAKKGGPEFSLSYIISKVKPPDTFKSCPIF
ncbi:MAG: hypothetical protein DHS20C18_16840 [Saprospiraceae bacterium]|nr:MAG: hypothetical protein DHS20C18_16840 [Saprospiraceae bacterium]